jgi:CYTH domain-containing protein
VSGQADKYARLELERRFLLGRLPEGMASDRGWRITDRYINSTHLRLRRMAAIHGQEFIFKLGRKETLSPTDFSKVMMTNIYLSPEEYGVLVALDALELHKLRHSVEHGDRIFSIDVFDAHLRGLALAEVSFQTLDEMGQTLHLPSWVIREVSDDLRFTGGALASLTASEATELIREITISRGPEE